MLLRTRLKFFQRRITPFPNRFNMIGLWSAFHSFFPFRRLPPRSLWLLVVLRKALSLAEYAANPGLNDPVTA